jgi:integrase
MPKIRLTDAACQRLSAPRGERVDYFDQLLPGLALRVSGPTPRNPDGTKSWVAFYRYQGKPRRLTLEPGYPALGLADARAKAREAFLTVERGEDPGAAKQAIPRQERGPDTIERVVDQFMRRHMVGKLRTAHYIATTRQTFDNHVLPDWRGRLIGDIKRRDVVELLDHVVDKRHAAAGRGGPSAANRTLAAISKLFNWAIQRGIIENSPATLVEKPGAVRQKTRVLSDAELTLVWRATEGLPYPWRPYFRLLIATGQRRSEVGTCRWRDIDGDVWVIPAESNPTDPTSNKPKRTHAVPLSRLALAALDECPQGPGYVFTLKRKRGGTGEAAMSGYTSAKDHLDRAVAKLAAKTGEAVPEPWTIHDLRRTATTGMGRLGVQRFILARVLNHADREVTGIYDRYEYLPGKRDALDRWAKHIETLINPPPQLRVVS